MNWREYITRGVVLTVLCILFFSGMSHVTHSDWTWSRELSSCVVNSLYNYTCSVVSLFLFVSVRDTRHPSCVPDTGRHTITSDNRRHVLWHHFWQDGENDWFPLLLVHVSRLNVVVECRVWTICSFLHCFGRRLWAGTVTSLLIWIDEAKTNIKPIWVSV